MMNKLLTYDINVNILHQINTFDFWHFQHDQLSNFRFTHTYLCIIVYL